ncbi:MAG TPA: D-alanyl-D-alanine carboxypeptidase/D-alanyl-D-alanine-endopeptidase [Acidimicrobiales bacterium]|nr:D-alanyl-D-alanine carboxypeptidase/D-alanyl-D-alanine-endopeptidase [Acidimicrobiales bacterium]
MRRPFTLPAALGLVACCATAAAFVLGGDGTTVARVPAAIAATTSSSTVTPTSPSSTTPPLDPAGLGALRTHLDGVWSQTSKPSSSCLMVLHGDEVLFERNPDLAVTPASTMKLLTATAVLARIDAHERLRTPVLAAAMPVDGVVHGDLYLVGGGDPVLGTVDWAAHFERQPRLFTSIESLADRIVGRGVREIRGRIVGDDGRYDGERYVASWPARYRANNVTGRLSALSVNDGFAVWDRRAAADIPWDDPPRDAAAVLTALLRARGVIVSGEPAAGAVASGSVELAAVDSPTIGHLVEAMLEDSDNGTAELLVKELGLRFGGEGTTAAGAAVVADTLTELGLPMRDVVVRDGSGLDPGNRITCRLLAAILNDAEADGSIVAGLPVAAQTGTLYKRFLATPVAGRLRAKTGWIGGVASLAGYADGPTGVLTFAQVLNGVGKTDGQRVQDSLGAALVGA